MNKESDIVTQVAGALEQAKSSATSKYGDIPVIYMPKKKWLRKPQDPGLSHFINQATTEAEVNKLLERGKTQFINAKPKTIRKWEKEASRRIAELKSSK